jgi:two-component system response regulator AtoC
MSRYQYANTFARPGQPLPRRERVLVVDDEIGIRMLLTRMLKGWGFGVWHVASADEALQIMEAEPADILLSDVSMPEHDGLWLAEQVHARWPRTAIVMSTAHQDPHTVQTSRKVGAVAYITKPFVAYVVQDALDRVSAQRNARPR